jgi:hypothetical protein
MVTAKAISELANASESLYNFYFALVTMVDENTSIASSVKFNRAFNDFVVTLCIEGSDVFDTFKNSYEDQKDLATIYNIYVKETA